MAFMVLATWLYVNAWYVQTHYLAQFSRSLNCVLNSGKGEECIPQTWDMFHEKWGFLVIFWNFAGVPFVSHPPCHLVLRLFLTLRQSYIYSVVYMASHDPSKYRFSTLGYVALYTTLLTAYYVYALSIFP